MVRIALTAFLLLATSGVNAFTASPVSKPFVTSATTSSTARFGLLTEEENDTILKRSHYCVEGECTVDDVSGLLVDLREQQEVLQNRLVEITNLVDALGKVNDAENREVDEVRETVRAIARLFLMGDKASGNDYPSLSKPTGWSGDVGDGATTAYDALPPKKWTPKAP
mmetsp:Transcript_13747/g.20063  ORF Transcript_13747/g.20063 Transcript_13747/m.20063 type:complete len:168 (-) Transcript_13747:258-761(-)